MQEYWRISNDETSSDTNFAFIGAFVFESRRPKGGFIMQKTGSFLKGLGTGMLAGAAVVAVGKIVLSDKHNITKGSTKVVKAVGDFVDGVQTMIH